MSKVHIVTRIFRFADGQVIAMPVRAFSEAELAEKFKKGLSDSTADVIRRGQIGKQVMTPEGEPAIENMNLSLMQFLASIGLGALDHGVYVSEVTDSDIVVPEKRIILPGHH